MFNENVDNILAGSPYLLASAYGAHQLSHNKPVKNAADQDTLVKLHDAYEQIAGDKALDIAAVPNSPKGDYLQRLTESFKNPNQFASSTDYATPDGSTGYQVKYNPNANSAYLAHELGHVAAATDGGIGQAIRGARYNPMVKAAASKASVLAPGAIAAITPGDDDLGLSIAASIVADSPIIADELMASVNAGKIMRKAGMPPTPGQRAKLGAALAAYIGTSAGKGAIANFAGNFMDEELAY